MYDTLMSRNVRKKKRIKSAVGERDGNSMRQSGELYKKEKEEEAMCALHMSAIYIYI